MGGRADEENRVTLKIVRLLSNEEVVEKRARRIEMLHQKSLKQRECAIDTSWKTGKDGLKLVDLNELLMAEAEEERVRIKAPLEEFLKRTG